MVYSEPVTDSQSYDAAFMASEDDWPQWPLLPVVSRTGGELGLMMADRGPIVFVGLNLFELETRKTPSRIDRYLTFEDCARDWRVD